MSPIRASMLDRQHISHPHMHARVSTHCTHGYKYVMLTYVRQSTCSAQVQPLTDMRRHVGDQLGPQAGLHTWAT